MQSVSKENTKNHMGSGSIAAAAALAIALLLALSNHRPSTATPVVPASNAQPAASARTQTLAEIMGSGQYPFGASGFDSVSASKPVAPRPAEEMSGQYPFGASGFDSLLPSQPAPARDRILADVIGSGQYPFGASGFDSLLPTKSATTPAGLITSGHYPFGATGFDSLLVGER